MSTSPTTFATITTDDLTAVSGGINELPPPSQRAGGCIPLPFPGGTGPTFPFPFPRPPLGTPPFFPDTTGSTPLTSEQRTHILQ